MAEIKNWVLVSTQIPAGYEALNSSDGIYEGPHNRLLADWEYRAYEVPEWGSFEGVEFDENDCFVVLAQGQSLTELPTWPYKRGMIGDIRSLDGEYLIVAPNGDFVTIVDNYAYLEVFPPQKFGLSPFPFWEPWRELGQDLTDQVFGE